MPEPVKNNLIMFPILKAMPPDPPKRRWLRPLVMFSIGFVASQVLIRLLVL